MPQTQVMKIFWGIKVLIMIILVDEVWRFKENINVLSAF